MDLQAGDAIRHPGRCAHRTRPSAYECSDNPLLTFSVSPADRARPLPRWIPSRDSCSPGFTLSLHISSIKTYNLYIGYLIKTESRWTREAAISMQI